MAEDGDEQGSRTQDGPMGQDPAPRRTRDGRAIVGPTVLARYLPGALIGLPLVSALFAAFAATGIDRWRSGRIAEGHAGLLTDLLDPMPVQLLLGWVGLWLLFAAWALVPMLLTHRVILLDEEAGTLQLRRGLRTGERVDVREIRYAVGEAERGYDALIGIGEPTDPDQPAAQQWRIPAIGWDDASFDGLRALQAAAGLRPAPSRAVLTAAARQERRADAHHEMARRAGMVWREEYARDDAAFQRDFDHARRVRGGKEPLVPGDPVLEQDQTLEQDPRD